MTNECPKCQTDNPEDATFCADCGTKLSLPKEPSVTKTMDTPLEEYIRGTKFAGRYEIIEKLGKGGMGTVYRVEDTKIGQEIALKLIIPEIASDKKTIKRFRNELKTTRMISHRNVCRMFDLSDAEGTYFITMEYIPGEDLKRFIKRARRLDAGAAIAVAKQICEGLAEAHRLGVVHRDLKSSNIMIDEEGNARIMDFGIARSLKAEGLTGKGIIIGTPEYMSPEQAEAKETDHRSDIYSLGVILYEMVTGQLPFEGDTPLSIAMKHKGEVPIKPKKLNLQISDELNQLILKCLEKEKEQRYQSAGELRSELENIERGIPTKDKVIPKRKPLTSKEITVSFSLKKLFIPIIILIAVVIIAVILWQVLPSKKASSLAPSGKPYLTVMYFQNNTGDENLDIWRDGLSRLLIADLSQSKYIRVVPDDQLYSLLNQLNLLEANNYSTENLREVASRSRATHILKGILTKSGDSFRINTTLQEAISMEIIDSEMVDGKGEGSLHTMVDDLTKRIKESFKLTEQEIAGDIDMEIGKITTSSPEAYKHYSEGRKYHLKGEYPRSIPFMEQAVAIDPEFAMAYRSMAMSYKALHLSSKGNKSLQKAFEFSHRVSERERLQIQGDFYSSSEKTWDKAIKAYNKLFEIYPDYGVGNVNLGILYRSIEQWNMAVEIFESQMKDESAPYIPFVNLAYTYMAMGLYDKARGTIEYSQDNFPGNALVLWYSAINYFCQGKHDLALAEAEKAYSTDPSIFKLYWVIGDIYLCQGDLITAEKEYQRLFEEEQLVAHLWGRRKLAHLSLLQGKFEESKDQFREGIELARKLDEEVWELGFNLDLAYIHLNSGIPKEALKECNKVWNSAVETESLAWKRASLHQKGLIYLEMDEIDKAQRAADELKEMIEKGINKKRIRIYYHLMGMIELERENFLKAIEYLMKAISLLPSQRHLLDDHALYIDSLASAYYKLKNFEKARQEFEKITTLTAGRVYYGDIYAKAFYMLGKIFEEQGDTAKAMEHYKKFLDLWKDANPGMPEVEDARNRLAAL